MDAKLLDKLNKLFAVAEKSTFPEEAANALAKAQTIMTQHKISKAMLDEYEEEEDTKVSDSPLNEEDRGKRNRNIWKCVLAQNLAKLNGCHMFTKGSVCILTGKESNISTVRYLYKYCVSEIDRLTKANGAGKGRTYCNNFRLGCVKAIQEAMEAEQKELREQAQRDKKELVVVDKVLAKVKEDFRAAEKLARATFRLRTGSSSARHSEAGRKAGYSAGQGIYRGRRSGSLPAPQKKIAY